MGKPGSDFLFLRFEKMDEKTTSEPRLKTFTCQLCGLSSPFTYYGQKPPNTRAIVLLEECFVTQDPFSPDKEKFLVLGSTCSLCNTCVCVGSINFMFNDAFEGPHLPRLGFGYVIHDCSLFYTKRFCMQCVNKHLDQFPHQIRAELAKKKQSSKAVVS